VRLGDAKVRAVDWIGDQQILLITSQTENLGYQFTTDKVEMFIGRIIPVAEGAKGGVVFDSSRKLVDAVVGEYGIRQIDGRWYGYFGAIELEQQARGGYAFAHGRPYLYRVDFQDLSVKRIANAAGAGNDNDWLVDSQGNVAATFNINDGSGAWTIDGPSGNTIASGTNSSGRIGLVGLGYDGQSVLFSERNDDISRMFEIPLAGGEPVPFLADVDIDDLYFDELTGHLLGYLEGSPKQRPVFAKPKQQRIANNVLKAFAGLDASLIDWSSSFGQFVTRTDGSRDSGTWFSVDVVGGRAGPIAYERKSIEPHHVGPISTFAYTASDGLEMDGILTLPPGREAKNLPVIVMPHGGPNSHDREKFHWRAQAFASRGYAVFQPNFRGSTNRTQSFTRAGDGEWGRKMQTDKSDGLFALAEAGIVDPKRACIVGASYGGYAALAGVTLQQNIYRCAVAVAPVSDIEDIYLHGYRATGRDRTTKVALLDQLGPRESWQAVSPLSHADKASAPIMLIHGRDDVVVPFSHSSKMADKLKDLDKPFEMVELDGEDHWLSLSSTRLQMLEASMRFVQQHNPPD